jgi:hypothetical protein
MREIRALALRGKMQEMEPQPVPFSAQWLIFMSGHIDRMRPTAFNQFNVASRLWEQSNKTTKNTAFCMLASSAEGGNVLARHNLKVV